MTRNQRRQRSKSRGHADAAVESRGANGAGQSKQQQDAVPDDSPEIRAMKDDLQCTIVLLDALKPYTTRPAEIRKEELRAPHCGREAPHHVVAANGVED